MGDIVGAIVGPYQFYTISNQKHSLE